MSNPKIDPIMLAVSESFESDRLLIRAPLLGDGVAINEAMQESLEQLSPWMIWAKNTTTPEESEIEARKARLRFLERKELRLLLTLKETGQFVGSSGLHAIDWEARKFEIGYWVRSSFARQGYISEAVEAITNYVIHELQANRVEIRCDALNTNSARVAKSAGFVLEGTLRKDSCGVDGELRDTMIFAKVRGIDY